MSDTRTAVLASAARVIAAVVDRGASADAALAQVPVAAERGAVRAIALGSVRWYLRLLPAVQQLLERKAGRLAPEISALLVAAAHQIEYSRNPAQLTVNAAVNAARTLGHARAAGLVNALLRRLVREREALFAAVDADPVVAAAHPKWLAAALERAWPGQSTALMAANNAHPPMTLRVDLTRVERDAYLALLATAGIEARASPWMASAVELSTPVPVGALPHFDAGWASVQDSGAQVAALLLDARPGMRILDACAAPGGKTLHVLERAGECELVAVDSDATRLERVRDNLSRCRRNAEVVVADMTDGRAPDGAPAAAVTRGGFDRILLDAPCSATGVIRRHPDIRLLRRESDIATFAVTQRALLDYAVSLLAPGGRLLYCTCSVLPQENDAVIAHFIASPARKGIRIIAPERLLASAKVTIPGVQFCAHGVQMLPGGEAGTDGFYYACLHKDTSGTL